MGIRINLQHASWLAYILKPEGQIPPFSMLGEDARNASYVFRRFVTQLADEFYSGVGHSKLWKKKLEHLYQAADGFQASEGDQFVEAVKEVRSFLGDRRWTALIVPSGRDQDSDRHLCNREFLRNLVNIRPEDPGLIIQLDEPPTEQVVLSGLFPAFRTALGSVNEWPGILIWRNHEPERVFQFTESSFFPLSESVALIEQSRWIFSQLADHPAKPLQGLATEYRQTFYPKLPSSEETTIIHLSDIHAGSKVARLRLPRLPSLVRQIMQESGSGRRYLITLSGDLMDTPNEENQSAVRSFIEELSEMTPEPLLTCWGNHDVRRKGLLDEKLRDAIGLLTTGAPVRSYCNGRLGIVIFNSVTAGYLANGYIGAQQLLDLGNALERHRAFRNASLIGIVHHHPVPVHIPPWYQRAFYERLLQGKMHKTDSLKDAANFINFVEARNFGCVLHGHKHIPHISKTPGNVAIYGCGSSVGKVGTVDGNPYVSVNVISFDPDTRRLTTRLLAERIDGGGLREQDRAEILNLGVMRSRFTP